MDVDNPLIDDDPDNETISNAVTLTPPHGSGTLTADTLTIDVTPDLSTSTKEDDDFDNNVTPGQNVTYTITVINTGNGSATGIDIDDTLSIRLENLSISSITNCGSSYTDNSTATPAVLDISNAQIDPGAN